MGYALAGAARSRGAHVVLVSGPTELQPPAGVELIRVTTAAEMRDAVVPRAARADVVIMAAAVADYAPADASQQKIHKDSGTLTLSLVRTPEILAELGRSVPAPRRPLLVGLQPRQPMSSRARAAKQREKQVESRRGE